MLSRTSSTSQKTMLKTNSIRPYPSSLKLLVSESVTATDVPRQTISATLRAAKFDAIRGAGVGRGGRWKREGRGEREAGRGGRARGVGYGVVAIYGRTSMSRDGPEAVP